MAIKRSTKLGIWVLIGLWSLYALELLATRGFGYETFAVMSHVVHGSSVSVQGLTIDLPWTYSVTSTPMTSGFSGGKGAIRTRLSGRPSHGFIWIKPPRPKLELEAEVKNLAARRMTYVDTTVIQVADMIYECYQFTGPVPAPFVPGEDTLIHCQSDVDGPQFVFAGTHDRVDDFYSIIASAKKKSI